MEHPGILVVEDDPTVSEVVHDYLVAAGFGVERVADGVSALAVAAARPPDLVVLDLMLPGLSGLEVCARLREQRPDLPVVILTALGEEEDRIAGLRVGADDYVVKPFSPRELVLRIRAILRRSGYLGDSTGPVGRIVAGDLVVDVAARTATRGTDPVALTVREFDLLVHLMSHPGRAFTREELMKQVWGWAFGDTSTVTVHVRRLREKVESDPSSPRLLVTVWGVGYRWDAP